MENTVIKRTGFKGFDKDLKCRGTQFVIGETYSKEAKEKPQLCSSDGFHYCERLKQVFDHYPANGSNRFCLIEVLGNHSKDNTKAITTSFKIIKELPVKEVEEYKQDERLNLEVLRLIQSKYPTIIIGGSVGLFLHGVKLKRFLEEYNDIDFDLILPYFQLMEQDESFTVDEIEKEVSGSDFEGSVSICGVNCDIRIDPKARYEIIPFRGHKYKVQTLELILDAKLKYALKGKAKHKEDIYEMVGKTKPEPKSQNEIPF